MMKMMLNASLDDAVTSASASSFTALLELPPTQVIKLLHDDDDDDAIATATQVDSLRIAPFASYPNSNHNRSVVPDPRLEIEVPKPVVERKLPEKKKKVKKKIKEEEEEAGRGSRSRKKSKEESQSQLSYVHIRARRGQATDSHSLAERARREKINARMKLLQELVPGCSKISGIALVLDEIINHVQALQSQVEFLSMQLAAANPRIEFNLDRIMDEENTYVEGSFLGMHPPFEWLDPQVNGLTGFIRSFGQQWQCDAYQQPQWLKEENHFESPMMPDTTHLRNDSPDTGCMQLRQL